MTYNPDKWKTEFDSERRSSTYDKAISVFSLRRDERLRVLKAILPKTSDSSFKILELGAGTGIITEMLAEHYQEATVVAVEGAKKMMKQAKSKTLSKETANRINWVLADYSSPSWLEYVTAPFDLIVSMDSLHHLTHNRKKELYQEVYDSLGRSGSLLVSDHITSGECYYKDPQYLFWIEEILHNLRRVEKESEIALLLENMYPWTYDDLKGLSIPQLHKGFTVGLELEGENPMPLMQHIEVMRNIGFESVIVEYRYSNFAIVSAHKGTPGQRIDETRKK